MQGSAGENPGVTPKIPTMRNGSVAVAWTLAASRPHWLMPEVVTGVPDELVLMSMFRPMLVAVSAVPLAWQAKTMLGSVCVLTVTSVPLVSVGWSHAG